MSLSAMSDISKLIDDLPRKDPAPDGNVIFSIGPADKQKSIRVSSNVLSVVSLVFKKMFASKFLEGVESTSTDPKSIDLPDDDADAMIWLCHGLHGVDLSTEAKIPLKLVEQVALLVDKYDCAPAMSSWTQIWLRQWSDYGWTVPDPDAER